MRGDFVEGYCVLGIFAKRGETDPVLLDFLYIYFLILFKNMFLKTHLVHVMQLHDLALTNYNSVPHKCLCLPRHQFHQFYDRPS